MEHTIVIKKSLKNQIDGKYLTSTYFYKLSFDDIQEKELKEYIEDIDDLELYNYECEIIETKI